MRKLDEAGEALPSKAEPVTINRALKTGNTLEKSAAPRSWKKLSTSEQEQSSPPKDPSKTISDPPVKKAKLLNTTSASCEESPSQFPKASLKRTASTDSEEELSSDGSKVNLFRERDEDDKARCVRQYSNRVKAKRKAEETSSDPQETCQELESVPTVLIQIDHSYGQGEGTGSSEVIVFACDQPHDVDVVIEASEEQMKTFNQPEVQAQENQIVYEPISSPESNDERETATEPERHHGVSLLDIQNPESQQVIEEASTSEENKICDPQAAAEENVTEQVCVFGSQAAAAVEMELESVSTSETSLTAQLEQSDVDVRQVAVISSSDDISTTDGQAEDAAQNTGFSECISASQFSDQVQEDAGFEEAEDVTVTTTTAATEAEVPDSTSEEYVISEPAAESHIPFDIVTQAVAESGLTSSFSEEVSQDDGLVGKEDSLLNGSQYTDDKSSDLSQQPSCVLMDVNTTETDMAKLSCATTH
ncbi:unnamed protein product [Pleuronectes platessa]|uniref:Uncharacterized protein n=1 Tax=Pleuronectes platessa TaxID=8262 RepID=A0A9N7VA62_PLEPL|nr:unnamed protein product [Pleuronectes platessa]